MPPLVIPPRTARRACVAIGALLAATGALSCGDARDTSSAAGAIECVRIEVANLALSEDPACTVASHELAARFLPDLGFTPGLCYTTGAVAVRAIVAEGPAVDLEITAFSGIDANRIAGAGLAPFPVPLVDGSGVAHDYIAFTAASVIEVRAPGGAAIGALVTRDAGWAEIEPPRTLPSFVSERLSVTGSSGDVLAGVVGEVLASGDEFRGIPARGSLCAPALGAKLARAAA